MLAKVMLNNSLKRIISITKFSNYLYIKYAVNIIMYIEYSLY